MTIRYKVTCTICEQNYLMRISLGHDEKQKHVIECNNCKSNMALELLINASNLSWKLTCSENCKEASFEDEGLLSSSDKYLTRNLHPELLIPKEFTEDSLYNANIFEGLKLVENRIGNISELSNIYEENLKPTLDYMSNLRILDENWGIIKIAWKMKNNEQAEELIVKHLKKYRSTTESSDEEFNNILFDFNNTILFPDFINYAPEFSILLRNLFEKSESRNTEYIKCIEYYKTNLLDENMKKFYDIYCDFFELYNDFKPLLLYIVTSQEINPHSNVSSHDFEKTKMFYGKLFEAYTSNISFITMLHNIYKGREFDKLNRIDLEKYLSTDKAHRVDNFKDTEEFKLFGEYVDSKLRNASHHGNIEIKDNIVIYKAGKPLKEYKMTYTKYLETCVQLFIRFTILHQLQILKYHAYLKYNR